MLKYLVGITSKVYIIKNQGYRLKNLRKFYFWEASSASSISFT